MKRLALLLLLVPGLAFADARVEARKRFRQGMAMIRDGRFEEGIDQLLEAYAIKPHPNVLANVAKAYENRVSNRVQVLMRTLEPLTILLLGGAVGFVVFSILMPLLKIHEFAQ